MAILRRGSKKYGTEIMNTEEVLLFTEAALEHNGGDIKEAVADFRMLDAMLHMKQLHIAVHGQIKKTDRGYTRKGVSYYDSLNKILEGRISGAFDY